MRGCLYGSWKVVNEGHTNNIPSKYCEIKVPLKRSKPNIYIHRQKIKALDCVFTKFNLNAICGEPLFFHFLALFTARILKGFRYAPRNAND